MVLQAPMFDGLSLDPFALFDDGFGPPEVGVCRRHIVEALVIVMLTEYLDLVEQEVILLQDAVPHRLVSALDLALGLRIEWRAASIAAWSH